MKADSTQPVKLIECPRDAMQGLHDFIPTADKVRYAQGLLACGFDTIDVGSFVSPRAIPQLRDTAEVLEGLNMDDTQTKLLTIVANRRGAEHAVDQDKVTYLGFPFSISETFLKRNINSSITDSLKRLDKISSLCVNHEKELVVYISMGFGNPYDEPWDADIVVRWSHRLVEEFGVQIINLSDTIGTSVPESINYLFSNLIPELPDVDFGAHLHTTPDSWQEKVHSAWQSGCRRFDGAIRGFGGCPMAEDELTGNMPMENILSYLIEKDIDHSIKKEPFESSIRTALEIFPN